VTATPASSPERPLRTEPFFFVIGSPRSGTTLLRNLLRSHPNLALGPESHFIPIFYRAWGDPPDEESRRRLIARVLDCHWVRTWGLKAKVSDFEGCTTYRDIVERLFRLKAGPKGHARVGDKTPAYAREIPTLCRIFPDAQFIHIIRDGRDVALSLRPMWFGFRFAYTAARYWRTHVLAGRRDGAPLGPDRYIEVRYEALLQDTEGVMRRLCEFLREPYDDRVLKPTSPHLSASGQPRGRMISFTEVVPANFEKWRTAMSRRDLEIFETAAGDLLQELGYERVTGGCTISPVTATYWRVHERLRRAAKFYLRARQDLWLKPEARMLFTRVRSRVKRELQTRWPVSDPS
jgi:hypothetical protein